MTNISQLPAVQPQAGADLENDMAAELERSIETERAKARQEAEAAASQERTMGSEHIMESMRRGTQNVITTLERQRDRQLDHIVAERRLREAAFDRDLKEARDLVADLQNQLSTNLERVKGLEEAKHAAIDASQTLFGDEQARFKTLIDAQRRALSEIS